MKLAFLLFLLGCFGTAHAGWFGPKNYDECILENMKGVTIAQAVWAIKSSCRAKFPQACYAWQREHDAYVKSDRGKPWVKYARKTDQAMLSSEGLDDRERRIRERMRSYMDAAPDGCYALLR